MSLTEKISKPSGSAGSNALTISDEEVVARVLAGDVASFEILMRRHNQRLYRIGRAILRNDAEAEDVMQDAYVRAYEHLAQFAGRAKFSTWLSRIAVNESLARRRHLARHEELEPQMKNKENMNASDENGHRTERFAASAPNPEEQASSSELQRLLEVAIEALPDDFRAVLVMRDVEEMDTAEAAAALDISEENVKVRLHRARALLRKKLYVTLNAGSRHKEAFPFHAVRCDRVVKKVFTRIATLNLFTDPTSTIVQ
ncbi:MAG: polymerase sigma-54 factor RpoN [Candidatus Angelobacter sp.]|nr:polymerase sigma-54 factor RpoN [Candidatus Angelobacter sp.]